MLLSLTNKYFSQSIICAVDFTILRQQAAKKAIHELFSEKGGR
jgi:hypothetical protein